MIDFIEYVVSELKSKRLSKTNAAALVRQFSRRAPGASSAALHPLLHRNTSDLSEQRFSSTFSGDEFFLADHQVQAQKVLPGVAYLEMARAAIEQALPARPKTLELRNVVWAQPIVVSQKKEVSIALLAGENEQIDFEVFSDDAVHCQGVAVTSAVAVTNAAAAPARIDVARLEAQMTGGAMEPVALYAACARMGLLYGPTFQAVTELRRGGNQLIAKLRLPSADNAADYVLHPSLMDGALQACVGLIDGPLDALTQPRVPFALDALRLFAPCTPEMFVWARYAEGSSATDSVVRIDIDLCDDRGNVCVQLRGFASRVMTATSAQTLLATPVWETATDTRSIDFAEEHTIVATGDFTETAIDTFERIQSILQNKPQGRVLVQVAASDPLFAGLSGLLKTASLENPQLTGQVVLVPADADRAQLLNDAKHISAPVVRFENGARQAQRWTELPIEREAPGALRDAGVYLITGGRGGLGTIFTAEILAKTTTARVILTGRAPFDGELPARVTYAQVDLEDAAQVERLIAGIGGELTGILHSAGTIADAFLLRKTTGEFRRVLGPKVAGTLNLDRATRDLPLDFFVLFAAIAGAMGNVGQADYAAANAFLDAFAAERNRLVAAGQRHGRTRAIDWPLWQSGGLGVDAANRDRLREATGMQPMATATGIDAFHRALSLPHDQLLVAEGDAAKLRRTFLAAPAEVVERPTVAATIDATDLAGKTQDYLRKELSSTLKVPAANIDPRAALENYGIDSILAMKLTNRLESAFGSLPKTLFFEYQTLRELAAYFIEQHAATLQTLFTPAVTTTPAAPPPATTPSAPARPIVSSRRFSRTRNAAPAARQDDEPIAIVGLSGRYPEAFDVEAYWENLRSGKDCITEVPQSRWDWREYYTEDRSRTGAHYSKWGGFIEGVDEFDPLFFNISPVDAEMIDPQERLFLQHTWMAIEDAGYTRASLQVPTEGDLPGQVGVYVGVMYTEYQLLGPDSTARGKRLGVIGSFASVANRVSYALNLHGPSMTLDTMCSSSLTAIHVACQDLKQGRTSLAIAGGVNVTVHPNKYLILSDGQFISGDGHCQSFGEGGDGYIPGEGVGVVVLKRLSDAERDGDHIYGIIRGSALNHGGKTNGYSVPNPQAQATAISRALAESHVNPRHISYIEAHGTGTKLGDPIEIAALQKVFQQHTKETQFCRIGSAKSNIGHCESAAGIAGLTKVLLQMQHRQIVPSLHSAQLNPHIDFAASPFVVNQELRPWDAPVVDGRTLPRIAGISSFGAGGSNAHMIIEEYAAPVRPPVTLANAVIVLSARTPEQLAQKARDLAAFLRPRAESVDLASLAYTLQVGREAMDERLAFVVTSVGQLIDKLEAWLGGDENLDDAYRGRLKRNDEMLAVFASDADLQQAIERWIASRKLAKLLDLWVHGLEVDWTRLYAERPQRITLPVYPFARERYWIELPPVQQNAGALAAPVLHPLLHTNTSDLSEQRYSSTFSGDEFFLADHVVAQQKVLPGVAYLEMARAAIEQAVPSRPERTAIELQDVVWAQPVIVDGRKQVNIALIATGDDQLDYEIYSDDETVHAQGRAVFTQAAAVRIELAELRACMTSPLSAEALYAACAKMGLQYGPSFLGVRKIDRGTNELLAEIRLPENVATNDYVLHPSVMDSALHAAVGLLPADEAQPRVPFALKSLRVLAPCTAEMVAWVRGAGELDIDLCDLQGNVCVQMRGFAARALPARVQETATLLAAPVWDDVRAVVDPNAELHVLRCEGGDYSEHAVACFEKIQSIFRDRPKGKVLLQVVAGDPLLGGLSALLKTAEQENPQFRGQLIVAGQERVARWEELPAAGDAVAFKDGGVYLITGGRGGLGTLFTREILARTRTAQVILTGRAPFDGELPGRVAYRQVDLTDLDAVLRLVASIQFEHHRLDGILHSAGMIADRLILNKSAAEFRSVLAPKVAGTQNLDQATRLLALDFFVLFSSLAGALGNVGQADYAAANGFLDRFAAERNRRVAAGERRGRTLSINWPLWQDGGMTVDGELLHATGMIPMQTASGMQAFDRALASGRDQVLVVEGDVAKLRRTLLATRVETAPRIEAPVSDNLVEKTRDYLRKELSALLKMPSHKIDPQAALEAYGIDSILAIKLTTQLEKTFGPLSKTLFFEYQTIQELAGYFAAEHAAQLTALLTPAAAVTTTTTTAAAPAQTIEASAKHASRRRRMTGSVSAKPVDDPIAIIGLSGRYPEAANVQAYWENLRDGKDCVTEVPQSRWDWREYFTEDRSQSGRHFSKWGGFIPGVDEFDPLFFNISPAEAEYMDPQERLFLQHAWMAMEDAGYTRASLQIAHDGDLAGQVGVYVGVMNTEYQLFGAEASVRGKRIGVPGSAASIANRVSYVLNLHGPSVMLDTMCSSSLTAIHFACLDLKLGRTNLAIAGGVNVTIHPNKYLVLSAGQFISGDGHCQSFGEGGDGYIPGEGVGAVILKRLSEAERDGDRIYGVIRGSALNHGGKTNGYTVPNPQAQATAISRALAESKTDPRHVSYIEAHGTGTKLGDPIEIAALSKAFATKETEFCRIGSAKSNIGHCESAAGMAGLTKVLLQMQHRQIVPSLHSARLNPDIDFPRTPFVVNQELRPWDAPVIDGRTLPRIAGISSFGAGGSNAHLIVEEYVAPAAERIAVPEAAIVLSARTPEQLRQKAQDLAELLQAGELDLASVAFTLQTGREPMDERFGFIARSIAETIGKLQAFVAGSDAIEDAYRGRARRDGDLSLFSTDADLQQTIDKWLAHGKLGNVLDLWSRGLDPDWAKLYGDRKPRRVSLPPYPFAKERYWIDVTVEPAAAAAAVLHPLLHSNTSDLSEQRYSTTFTGEEFFAADHVVHGQKLLPGVAYLEMARAAVERSLPARDGASILELRNTVWARPVVVDGRTQISIALSATGDDEADYEIYSDEDVVHCQGQALARPAIATGQLDLSSLEARMSATLSADAVYASCARLGLAYGPSMRAIEEVRRGAGELLVRLRVPQSADYVLHPALLDGALQACIALADGADRARLPFALDTLRIFGPTPSEMRAWVRLSEGSRITDDVVKVDIDLCDVDGNVCVQLHGLSSRAVSAAATATLYATPAWETRPLAANVAADFAGRHVIRCEHAQYADAALQCFERIQSILQSHTHGKVLVQVVVQEPALAGLAALLKSAAMENPQFVGQLIVAGESVDLRAEERSGDTVVRYERGTRQVLRWTEIPTGHEAPSALRDTGIYLITGGRGGLGTIFAEEILRRTQTARVILTGRSQWTGELPERVSYRQLDLENASDVRALIDEIGGDLTGILHSAGMIADGLIVRKTREQFRDVLAPKVAGTLHLDEATRDIPLDFFVLFSSVASMGNIGQSDYAAANGFLDQFAAQRNALVAAGRRHGRTRSINWPLWQSGGMHVDAATEALLRQTTGMAPLQTTSGIAAFHRALALPYDQLLVVEGDAAKLRRAFVAPVAQPAETQPVATAGANTLLGKAQDFLRSEFSSILKLPAQKIDPNAALEVYGIDSIVAMKLTSQLEKTFGSLSKTLFFEYQTLAALAAYLVKAFPAVLQNAVGETQAAAAAPAPQPVEKKRARTRKRRAAARPEADQAIAIVGLGGRYPHAQNLREFWRNLRDGRDSITEVPSDRWNHALYFDADPTKAGKSYSKWGGFLADVDKFDALFFNISPKEAELLDPQERLFLETAWETIEDAGYTKDSVAGRRVGVFVGVMWGQYELYGAEAMARGTTAFPGSSHASIANRVSYFFDFHGPSIALDTMCSSSLTAIHLACDALRRGEIEAAIAGGVNLTIHPYKYLSLSQGKFAATDGRCRAFGAGGDGYVPGEGVGAVLLKPLDAALRDGDQVYAIVRSTSVNHGGKTNGYSVPNPNAQGDLIADALRKAEIDPRTLSYLETHGTGTSLGDPIEITGLLKAFEGVDRQSCPIGSVKSNIGHLESAAGIASITKALLQLRHDELVPSLHADPPNPNIDFTNTPFYVQTALAPWTRKDDRPRRVGVSSFGAGGSNAHIILEEHVAPSRNDRASSPDVFVLSARNEATLRRYAERFVSFLAETDLPLADIAYTSRNGRTPMDARLAIIANSVDDLRTKLAQWLSGEAPANVAFGVRQRELPLSIATHDSGNSVAALQNLWIQGADVEWPRNPNAKRTTLPTYPFNRERYWIAPAPPALPLEDPKTSRLEDSRQLTNYIPDWKPKAIGPRGEQPIAPVLVLDSAKELFRALRKQTDAASLILAQPGEPLQELVENLRAQDRLPRAIVHHVESEEGVYALFELCQALLRETHAGPVRILSVHSGTPYGAAISGFLETLSLEDPRFLTKTVEIPAGPERASIVLDELYEEQWTAREIRHRNGERLVSEVVPHTLSTDGALPLREDGVYVVTGGMGGLGFIFAEHLAKNYRARLVLAGRSELGARHHEQLRHLESLGGRAVYVRADVARREDVDALVAAAKTQFGALHGVIHSAGVNRDAFLIRKTREAMAEVIAPKVQGAMHLDAATRDENLDVFILFSSLAGTAGNAGQCDYAYANRFLDAFAEQRAGRTISIDWPLWAEGGMHMAAEDVARLEQQTGMVPLPTGEGIRAFEDILRSGVTRCIPVYATVARPAAEKTPRRAAAPAQSVDDAALTAQTEAYLKTLVGEEIKLDPERIGSHDPLESFGLDSVMIGKLNTRLERDCGALPKTLFYEHETVHALAAFLTEEAKDALVALFGTPEPAAANAVTPEPIVVTETRVIEVREHRDPAEPIAIIGMHGTYPESATLREYWDNLKHGRDLVGLVPKNRWDWERFYDADPASAVDGRIYHKWGGFISGHDEFDPHFFKIATAEAPMIDPQERLFLQSVWAAIEDAGYTRERLKARHNKNGSANVGVFAGVTTNSYHLWAPEEWARGNYVAPTAMPWSIANRVSYFFDFNGPSLPVDTACSSSLVAIHLACESLRNRECQVAIAGGVNLYLHPAKYHSLCQRRMVSLDGKTHSYGAGDDGFVPSEGVGSIVLKPLSQAIADGDPIYSVIRSSAYDHSGRSNGYSAPNPNAQASLIRHTLEKADIHPETIGFVEGHGTGTQLGDSLEIAALTRAFRASTEKKQFCPIGSVKANAGHSESAAGIAGVAKVVLQLQHKQLAPSIHAAELNPNIEFEDSPFYLQRSLSDWTATEHPRRALVNSFGAGGVNACVVLEEYVAPAPAARAEGPYLFTLSAKNEERLREYAARVVGRLQAEPDLDLASLCYTYQAGRDVMEERLATVVSDARELVDRLDDWSLRGWAAGVQHGTVVPKRNARRAAKLVLHDNGEEGLVELAAKWVAGEDIDWSSLYAPNTVRRIPAPTYPFARERYWVSETPVSEAPAAATPQLHPLLNYNSSTLKEVSFSSLLSDTAFYAVDHKVQDQPIFPGAGFLEMACISANVAGEQRVRKIKDVIWMQPLGFANGPQSVRTALRATGDLVEYTISSLDDENDTIIHSEGRLTFWDGPAERNDADDRLNIQELKSRCAGPQAGEAFYEKFAELGLQYGPSFRTVQELYIDGAFALSRLKIAEHLRSEFPQFVLHPSLVDGALQTVAALVGSTSPQTPYLPFALDEVEVVGPLPETCYAYAERASSQAQSDAGVTKFHIRLLNESGDVLIRFTNLYVRPLVVPAAAGALITSGESFA